MIEYYHVSGCYIIRPLAFFVWEQVQKYLDQEFKATGTQNVSFPMFVKKQFLQKEADHIQGFEPEVAWITKAG